MLSIRDFIVRLSILTSQMCSANRGRTAWKLNEKIPQDKGRHSTVMVTYKDNIDLANVKGLAQQFFVSICSLSNSLTFQCFQCSSDVCATQCRLKLLTNESSGYIIGVIIMIGLQHQLPL